MVFPFPYYTMEKKEHIEKEQWKHNLLFTGKMPMTCQWARKDMEMEKDTGLTVSR